MGSICSCIIYDNNTNTDKQLNFNNIEISQYDNELGITLTDTIATEASYVKKNKIKLNDRHHYIKSVILIQQYWKLYLLTKLKYRECSKDLFLSLENNLLERNKVDNVYNPKQNDYVFDTISSNNSLYNSNICDNKEHYNYYVVTCDNYSMYHSMKIINSIYQNACSLSFESNKEIIESLTNNMYTILPIKNINNDGYVEYLYNGQLMNRIKNGSGILYFKNGASYIGAFKNNKFSNHGKLILDNNLVYEGHINDELSNIIGKGKFCYSEADYCEGFWIDNMRNGYYEEIIGSVIYRGYYYNDKREGEGEIEYKGLSFKTVFSQNRPGTKADITYDNKNYYSGEINQELKPHGLGIYYYSDLNNNLIIMNKKLYKGHFHNGLKHGYGIQIINDCEIRGQWTNGIMNSYFIKKDLSSEDSEYLLYEYNQNELIKQIHKSGESIKGILSETEQIESFFNEII